MSKIAFLFPGQGSQAVGMGKELCEKYPEAEQIFNEANDILGIDLKKMCFEGPMEELTRTENAQPALLTMSYALFQALVDDSIKKNAYFAGHSLGEYSALVCSGCIKFSDALKIVRRRGQLMQQAASAGGGIMSSISGISRHEIEDGCRKISKPDHLVFVSNYNSKEQIVVSGHKAAVMELTGKLELKGARVIHLKVSAPFHTVLMEPAAQLLKEELQRYDYTEVAHPVVSNVFGRAYENTARETIVPILVEQMTVPVKWEESMTYLKNQGVIAALEIGPGHVLKNLMKHNEPSIGVYSWEKSADREKFQIFMNQQKMDNKDNKIIKNIIEECLSLVVCLKNYSEDDSGYQKLVTEPYQKVKQKVIESDSGKYLLNESDLEEALVMINQTMQVKKTPLETWKKRWDGFFDKYSLEKFRYLTENY